MKRIFKSIGIATVVAAFTVPSAFAMHASGEYAGALTGGNALSVKADTSDVFTRYVANHKITPIPYLSHGVGVDTAPYGGTGVANVSTRPDDRAGTRVSEPSSIVSVASTGSGFDWADAGIGAGGAFGLVLLMGLGVAATQRNRKGGPLAA
jgi:hypothetical protein